MRQPEGFSDDTARVCLLRRSLYGLKQASRCWNQRFVDEIGKFGLKQSLNDSYIFVRDHKREILILGIYVDDGVVISSNQEEADELIAHLERSFEVTTSTGQFLGMKVTREENGDVVLSQKAYTGRVLRRFRMQDSCPVSTPLDRSQSVCSSNSSERAEQFPYREAVGCLNFLAVVTRPDIAYAVGVAGRSLQHPGPADVRLVKRILRYLKGTMDYELRYKAGGDVTLVGYSDADYAGDPMTRKSTSGALFQLAGGAVHWTSRRQRIVALSTAEAEYISPSRSFRSSCCSSVLFVYCYPVQPPSTNLYKEKFTCRSGTILLEKHL